jgi:chromosome segregation ATPase
MNGFCLKFTFYILVIIVVQVECLNLQQIDVLIKSLQGDVQSLKAENVQLRKENQAIVQTLKKLRKPGVSIKLDDCPCDLSSIEESIQDNGEDITHLRINVALVVNDNHDIRREFEIKMESLNTTLNVEHEAILSNGDLIQKVQQTVDDINFTKPPIGTIMAWISKVNANLESEIDLPLGISTFIKPTIDL